MAGASSPERPVVLRRLGIIKDPGDSFLQESRAPRETSQDALGLFATEAEPAPRRERWATTTRPDVASSIDFVRRNPVIAIIAVSAVLVVAGIWAIDRLLESDVSSSPSQASVGAATDSAGAAPNDTTATAPTAPAKPRATAVNAVRTGNTNVAPGEQLAGDPADGEGATAAIAQPVVTPQQSERLGAAASIATTDAPAAAAPAASEATAAVVDDAIYSAQDRDVIPPQTEEQLPGPTISAWSTRTNAMEVIVSQTGAVERVRLITPPQRMPDMFALSRAKVWMFKPAMKDGRPVRYRLLLTWEVNP